MVWEVSSEITDDSADEVIMEVFGFGVGAYNLVDAGGEFALIEMAYNPAVNHKNKSNPYNIIERYTHLEERDQ